ncbi:hypothetical protein LTR12_014709 [Friedmanniomyces endolithicus]|nr:hypothetical protein LTR12_014709 [Friedmanniomyces endolithicus]
MHADRLGNRPIWAGRDTRKIVSTNGGFTYFGFRHKSTQKRHSGLQPQSIDRSKEDIEEDSEEADRATNASQVAVTAQIEPFPMYYVDGNDDTYANQRELQQHYRRDHGLEHVSSHDPYEGTFKAATVTTPPPLQQTSESWGKARYIPPYLSYTWQGSAEDAPRQRATSLRPASGISPSQQQASSSPVNAEYISRHPTGRDGAITPSQQQPPMFGAPSGVNVQPTWSAGSSQLGR